MPPAASAGSSGPSCRWAVRLRHYEEPFGGVGEGGGMSFKKGQLLARALGGYGELSVGDHGVPHSQIMTESGLYLM